MNKMHIVDRDVSVLRYLHKYKVATVKQMRRDVLEVSDGPFWRRIKKLRLNSLIESKGNDSSIDGSTVFSLAFRGYRLLQQRFPDCFTIDRYKSNSLRHDLNLLEVQRILTQKSMVIDYWTENEIQTLAQIEIDERVSLFKIFQFDALARLGDTKGSRLICGLEYESSTKSKHDYSIKISAIYRHHFLKSVLYICEDQQIENALKKCEASIAGDQDKKLYFIQTKYLFSGDKNVTFKNQNNRNIEIR